MGKISIQIFYNLNKFPSIKISFWSCCFQKKKNAWKVDRLGINILTLTHPDNISANKSPHMCPFYLCNELSKAVLPELNMPEIYAVPSSRSIRFSFFFIFIITAPIPSLILKITLKQNAHSNLFSWHFYK